MEAQFIHSKEKLLFTICLVISIITYFFLFITIIGIFYIAIGIFITLFLHGLAIGHIRTNGVKLTETQFPEIYKQVQDISRDMEINELPDVFIMESGGVLNAFATSFLGKKFIVLYSDIVEVAKDGYEDELKFIIAHELAHIKRNHVSTRLLILPSLWIPFLGNAYSRACEYTCDQMATAYTNNFSSSTNALAILAVGKRLFVELNILEYIQNAKKESGFFVWLSQILSTHPPLPKRIEEVQQLHQVLRASATAEIEYN